MSGRPKPKVLPVPVLAWPMMSWPERASGMVWLWIGKGSMMPFAGESVDHVLVDGEIAESQGMPV